MSTINPTAEASSLPAFSASGILKVLGSLRLTVVLFALSLVIVMVGTLVGDDFRGRRLGTDKEPDYGHGHK